MIPADMKRYLHGLAADVLTEFFTSPEGKAMIFEEADKVRQQLGITEEEFRRGLEGMAA